MPPGAIHTKIYKNSLVVFMPILVPILIGISISTRSMSPFGFIIGYFIGSFVDPDLDQLVHTTNEARILHWFKDAGALFIGFFSWYAYRFKHRGISHSHIIGTLTRWMWFFFPLMIIWGIYGEWNKYQLFINPWFWWIFAGNATTDSLHILADMRSKLVRRLIKR